MGHTSWAAKGYVTDSFRISLRRGPSIENKILKFLPSGYPVEILKTEEGWSLVHSLADDQENLKGWVLSRYLIIRPPWENQAKLLLQENAVLKEKLAHLEGERDVALKQEADKHVKLKTNHESSQETIQMLTKENENLRFSQKNRLFLSGALVLLCGLISGMLVGRQQKKQRLSL
ncbi:MAG: TIGR04211 family SH3 domain-containing protein [Desulfobacteraceae bacterium]|nr:TIGR04211 family SH3 domain-containing protein [Desulfobacteraceae bacterium]